MKILILGSGQDAGIPQAGCYCSVCKTARVDMTHRRLGPSIAVLDEWKGFCYFVDASPDFKHQLDMARRETDETKKKRKNSSKWHSTNPCPSRSLLWVVASWKGSTR